MSNRDVQSAVGALAEAVHAVRPLAGALERPVRVPVVDAARDDGHLGAARLLAEVARVLGIDVVPDQAVTADRLEAFELVVFRWLEPVLAKSSNVDMRPEEIEKIVARVVADSFDRFRHPADVVSFDGARLPVYTAGNPAAPAVVLASACGMPAQLCAGWLELLGRDHFAITWESRGLFGRVPDFDNLEYDTEAQARDALALMDHFGIETAHLMGFCGGSVIGLYAANMRPERILSLSLWHGAYELGPDSPKLDHHRNIQALMAMAAQSRQSATAVHSVFLQTMLGSAPLDMAHLVLYPFATPELFYRYCKVNGAITDIDVNPLLDGVRQPALVVTSEDDNTANPLGSIQVAERLPNAVLRVEPHGDHISLFKMGGQLGDLALDFLRGTRPR